MAFTEGDLAPEISVPNSWGDTFTLSEAVKENVVVLTFYFFAFTGG
jgi:peroxiredoxin